MKLPLNQTCNNSFSCVVSIAHGVYLITGHYGHVHVVHFYLVSPLLNHTFFTTDKTTDLCDSSTYCIYSGIFQY